MPTTSTGLTPSRVTSACEIVAATTTVSATAR